jgi:hypothetical protein
MTGSKRFITSAVCTACVPEPTSRLMSGSGRPQVLEQAVASCRVVVLAGVHQQGRDRRLVAAKARRMGAIFMKLGRAPTTHITGPICPAGGGCSFGLVGLGPSSGFLTALTSFCSSASVCTLMRSSRSRLRSSRCRSGRCAGRPTDRPAGGSWSSAVGYCEPPQVDLSASRRGHAAAPYPPTVWGMLSATVGRCARAQPFLARTPSPPRRRR